MIWEFCSLDSDRRTLLPLIITDTGRRTIVSTMSRTLGTAASDCLGTICAVSLPTRYTLCELSAIELPVTEHTVPKLDDGGNGARSLCMQATFLHNGDRLPRPAAHIYPLM